MKLLINGIPKRTSISGYGVKAVLVQDDDNETEVPVSVMYDYTPREADQGNPDRPNPGPGHDAAIDITEIIGPGGNKIDPTGVEFDAGDFLDATDEVAGRSVSWNRRMAGM